jgi:hypothetical protein
VSRCGEVSGRPLLIRLCVGAAVGFIGLSISGVATAGTYKKIVDRRFPTGQYCPIDPALTLTFTATGPDASLTFTTNNFDSVGGWNAQSIDDIAVVDQAVFQANQVVTPGFEVCYVDPGTFDTPGYDFNAGSPEAFLDLLDSNATKWTLGSFGYFRSLHSAPRDPLLGQDQNGGSLGLGHQADGAVSVSVTTQVTGLIAGHNYVVTGWWYTENLAPLDIAVTVPTPLNLPGVSFAPRVSGTDFSSTSGSGVLTGSGTFVTPLPLAQGSTIRSLEVVSYDPDAGVTARIERLDTTVFGAPNPTVLASIASAPQFDFLPHSFRTTTITGGTVDVSRYFYFASITLPPGSTSQVYRVSIVVSDPATPPSPATAATAGVAFDPDRSTVDLKGYDTGTLTSTGPAGTGRFDAPLRLPQGATVQAVRLVARDASASDATARLIRVPNNAFGGTVMASIASTGSLTSVRTFSTTTIATPVIDNNAAYYYLQIETPPGIQVYGIKVEYAPPASIPASGAESLAAVPFLPDDSSFDRRVPVSDALAGQARFNTAIQLQDNQQVMRLLMHVQDNDNDGDVTAFLYRYDVTTASVGPQLMAQVQSSGAVSGVREFVTDTIVGRVVDNSRYFYYAQFYMGLTPVQANGLQVEYAPCGDNDGDGFDGCVNDCNDLRAAVRPGGTEVCDGVRNDCNDTFWPSTAGTIDGDDDFDGFSECQGDCNDSDSSRWSPPGEAQNLQVNYNLSTGSTTISWAAPANPGGSAAPVYDTVQSSLSSNFNSPSGVCADTNGTDLVTSIASLPVPVGQARFFLVRAEGACGAGRLGTNSAGGAIAGRSCP